MCSDLDKSPCVQNDRTKSTRRALVLQMGAFQGEWHINLHISPTTCSFCSIVFAMIVFAMIQAQLYWNLHIRAELKTCKLGEPYPRSMQTVYPFWASVSPLCPSTLPVEACCLRVLTLHCISPLPLNAGPVISAVHACLPGILEFCCGICGDHHTFTMK
jgi:hypothetical protein